MNVNVPQLEETTRQSIIDHNLEVLYYFTMQPGNTIELGLALFIAILLLTFSISKIHAIAKAGVTSVFLTLFVVIFCSFFMVQVASFSVIWLSPLVNLQGHSTVFMSCLVAASFIFMVIPFTRFLLRSGYFISLTAWVIGLSITLAALFLFSRTYESPRAGDTPLDTLENVREEFQDNNDIISVPPSE